MKRIKSILLLLLLITAIIALPGIANAASATFSVTGPQQGIVGNTVTINVKLSSSVSLGSWDFSLSYDKTYLELSSAPEGANGTRVVGNAKGSGTKNVEYKYVFKVKKSGTASIATTNVDVYAWDTDGSSMSSVNGSKKITLKTQAEIEASYSSDAYLKSISVGEYTLEPTFNKDTTEYTVEVPNEIEKVTISASKNDANASISGTGEKELKEGSNKFEIVCTAQKGNSLTYTVTVNRKELNPIPITINGSSYSIIRKSEELPEYKSFILKDINYNEDEIPALINEGIGYTLIGVKDAEGNVYTYIFDNGNVKDEYYEITTGDLTILPKSITDSLTGLIKKDIIINGHTITGYALKENSKQVIIKGVNVYNGTESYYLYDVDNKIFITINIDDLDELNKQNDTFKLIIIILGVVVALLILLVIIKKPSRKEKIKIEVKEEDLEDTLVNAIKVNEVKEAAKEKEKEVEEKTEEVEEPEDDEEEEEVKPTKLSRRARKKIAQEEAKRLKELEKEEEDKQKELEKEEKEKQKRLEDEKKEKQKQLEEEIAKQEKELKERKKKVKEKDGPKSVEDIVDEEIDDEELDDPLDQDDDFMEFWETMEIKTQKKKD